MLNHIAKFSVSYCLPYELHVVAGQFADSIGKHAGDDEFIAAQVAAITVGIRKLAACFKKERRSPLTGKLVASDRRRGKAIRGLVLYLKGVSGLELDPERKAAADSILEIIYQQGRRIERMTYEHETSAIQNILKKCAEPKAVQCIQAVGAAGAVAELAADQADFEQTFQEKIAVDAARNQPLTIREARDALEYRITVLFGYIDAIQTDGKADFSPLIKVLNELIAEIMTKARARKTRQENAEQEEQGPELGGVSGQGPEAKIQGAE